MLKWLNNIKIRNKLIGGFLAVIAMLLLVFGISWNALNLLDVSVYQIA
jgi:CHASE3 domain sensor protein